MMTYTKREQMMFATWDFMVEMELATEEEIGVACHFGGRSLETLESLLFYKTGYRTLLQILEDE